MNLKVIKKIPKSKDGVLIEGLPGIGNVGKIAADYVMESLDAKKIIEISSKSFPNLVIINEENLVELPKISIWHKKADRDYYFVEGDFQPGTEEGSYQLSEAILDFCKDQGITEIITLGGIGLEMLSDDPKIYTTGNDKKTLQLFKKAGADTKLYGKVGTILGVTGLLLGMAKIPASALLVETSFEPGITAISSAKKIVEVLNKRFKLKISLEDLNDEFLEDENKHLEEVEKAEKIAKFEETNYIG